MPTHTDGQHSQRAVDPGAQQRLVIAGEDTQFSAPRCLLHKQAVRCGSRLKAGMTKNKAGMTKLTIELEHLQTSQGRINKVPTCGYPASLLIWPDEVEISMKFLSSRAKTRDPFVTMPLADTSCALWIPAQGRDDKKGRDDKFIDPVR